MITQITGQKDPAIRLLADLRTEDGRARQGLYFVEEREIVARALEWEAGARCVFVTDRFADDPSCAQVLEAADGLDIFRCSEGLLGKTLGSKPTPECVAILERRVCPMEQITSGERPLITVVENCENSDNLGMLLRSTDATGVSGVLLLGETTDPFSRRSARGSRGAVFTVPLAIERDTGAALRFLRERSIRIIAGSANATERYDRVDYTGPTAIIVGNEHVGISDQARRESDDVVSIPMRGRVNSLNIAVAASVMMYEALRQRG